MTVPFLSCWVNGKICYYACRKEVGQCCVFAQKTRVCGWPCARWWQELRWFHTADRNWARKRESVTHKSHLIWSQLVIRSQSETPLNDLRETSGHICEWEFNLPLTNRKEMQSAIINLRPHSVLTIWGMRGEKALRRQSGFCKCKSNFILVWGECLCNIFCSWK